MSHISKTARGNREAESGKPSARGSRSLGVLVGRPNAGKPGGQRGWQATLRRRPTWRAGVVLALAMVGGWPGRAVCLTGEPHEPPPVPIELKPEMAGIAELDDWQPCSAEDLPEQPDWQATIKARWNELRPWLQRRVTAAAVRRLSRWAKPQMEAYKQVPPLEKAVFEPVRRDPQGRHVLYEATLDTLPTHHHLVTRWLKAYLVFDPQSQSVQKVTITIRGRILE